VASREKPREAPELERLGDMRVASAWKRNISGMLLVGALSFFSVLFAPRDHVQETELKCSDSTTRIATFADMETCSQDPRFYQAGCSCGHIPNPWFTPYYAALVPTVIALGAYSLLQGRRPIRLLLLNAGIILGIAGVLVRGFIQGGRTDPEGVLFFHSRWQLSVS
jgi:hypothetical protein